MKVGAGAPAGAADIADAFAVADISAGLYPHYAHVGVECTVS